MRTGAYTVRCRAFKETLATSAEGLVRRLLGWLRASVRASNVRVNEEYQVRAWGGGQCQVRVSMGRVGGGAR